MKNNKLISLIVCCFLAWSLYAQTSSETQVPVPFGDGIFVPQNPSDNFFPTYPFMHGGKRGAYTLEFDVTPLNTSVVGAIAFDAYVARWANTVRVDLKGGHFQAGNNDVNILAFTSGKTYHITLGVNCDGGANGVYTVTITYDNDGTPATVRANGGVAYDFAGNRRIVSRLKEDIGRWPDAIPESGTNIVNLGAMGAWASEGNFVVKNFKINGKTEGLCYAVDDLNNLPPLTRPAGINTFEVGPNKTFKKIQDVMGFLQDGDRVLVDGNTTYPSGVTIAVNNVTFRGVPVNGVRPLIKTMNSSNTTMIEILGDNVVFDSFIIEGGNSDLMKIWGYESWTDWAGVYLANTDNSQREVKNSRSSGRCIRHAGDNLLVRNCKISGSGTGIISSDMLAGAITVEYCEIFENGAGPGGHNLYLANNIGRYPKAETVVRYCYIYQSIMSVGLKSRCHINKIYYNYFYNNSGQALELLGPDPGNESGSNAGFSIAKQINQNWGPYNQFTFRCDHDVVGNTIIYDVQERNFYGGRMVRCGADGTSALSNLFPNTPGHLGKLFFGKSWGRFRFVNNTFLYAGSDAGTTLGVSLQFSVESVEFYNNIFYSTKSDFLPVFEDLTDNPNRIAWTSPYGRQIAGANNAVIGRYVAENIPSEWTGTITGVLGDNPFVSAPEMTSHYTSYDLHLKENSPLIAAGVSMNQTVHEWPSWTEEQALTFVQYVYDGYDIHIPSKNYLDFPNSTAKALCRDTSFPFPLRLMTNNALDPVTMKAASRNDNERPSLGAYGRFDKALQPGDYHGVKLDANGRLIPSAYDKVVTFENGKTPEREIFIAPDGNDVSGIGTIDAPYKTVSKGMEFATPGTAIRIMPGEYDEHVSHDNLRGTETKPIWIGGIPGKERPKMVNANGFINISGGCYVILHDMEVLHPAPYRSGRHGIHVNCGAHPVYQVPGDLNTINLDLYNNPDAVHHFVFRNLYVHHIGDSPFKLSGVYHYWLFDCEVAYAQQGLRGSGAIDNVGSHHATVAYNYLHHSIGIGIVYKGGSSDADIHNNLNVDFGACGVQMGQQTGKRYFIPPLHLLPESERYEAKNIRTYSNIFIGGGYTIDGRFIGSTPFNFSGAINCYAVNNTIINPSGYLFRILHQELIFDSDYPTAPRLSNNGAVNHCVISNNIFYYGKLSGQAINIGGDTAPETFTVQNNLFYCTTAPNSKPDFGKAPEENSIFYTDPLFEDVSNNNFTIRTNSPAIGKGADVLFVKKDGTPFATEDYERRPFKNLRSIGAIQY